jgi:hypothetical protein
MHHHLDGSSAAWEFCNVDIFSLRSDCERCAALCCVALAFDRSSTFAIDKAAGSPCPNLDNCSRCNIHTSRAELGFSGCIRYDCLGAGQRVVQSFFYGKSWLENGDLLVPMLDAFFVARIAHEHLELLELAASLPLLKHQERHRRALSLSMIIAGVSVPRVTQLAREVKHWLRDLGTPKA